MSDPRREFCNAKFDLPTTNCRHLFLMWLATHIRSRGEKTEINQVSERLRTRLDCAWWFPPSFWFFCYLLLHSLTLHHSPMKWNRREKDESQTSHDLRGFRNVFPVAFYLARVSKNEPRTAEGFFHFIFLFLFLPDFYDGATIKRSKNTWKWE